MKKIMFNDNYLLTHAVSIGFKTNTRRLISQKELERIDDFKMKYYEASLDSLCGIDLIKAYYDNNPKRLPYKVGEVVAVAQRYEDIYADGCNIPVFYESRAGWKNKMFVSAELMPIKIKILGWQPQYLNQIPNDDCLKEGVFECHGCLKGLYTYHNAPTYYNTPKEAFASLINRVSGKGTWESNPWVLAFNFERIK